MPQVRPAVALPSRKLTGRIAPSSMDNSGLLAGAFRSAQAHLHHPQIVGLIGEGSEDRDLVESAQPVAGNFSLGPAD